jgi:hypothetical protein
LYTTYDQHTEVIGRLRRRALVTAPTDVVGFYGYTINWSSNGTIADVTDSLGRQITFQYLGWPAGCSAGNCSYNTLVGISSKHSLGAAFPVATFTQAQSGQVLHYVQPVGVGTYKRFRYLEDPLADCKSCSQLLTDVIVPISGATPPASVGAPLGPNEVAFEHHVFEISPETRRPRAIESAGPGRRFAYDWDDASRSGVQYDLTQPRGSCASGCNAGEACNAGTCYVAQQLQWSGGGTQPERLPVRNHPFGAPSSLESGNPMSLDMTYSSPSGAPARATDPSDMKTTNGYDSSGRLRCIVRKDSDDEAFAPDGSCSGPADAQIVRVDYTPTTITKTTPSLLGAGSVTETQTLDSETLRCSPGDDGTLFPCAIATTGTTRDINGTSSVITTTSTRTYDAIGRLLEVNGPLDDGLALDKTTTTYYASYDQSWPHDIGRVQSVKRYVGTTGGNTELTTTYSEYDVFGVPHRITGPNGDQVTYSPSTDRLTWTITQIGVGGGTIGSSVVRLNGDGTVRSMQDADGVCMTYEYKDASGYVGAPTVIQRYAWTCGTVPININQGEVEIRTYVNGDASRLASVQRRNNGGVELNYSGFTYDRDRRLTNATTLDSALPFTFGFTDVLPSSTIAPGGPAAGSWRTDTTADSFGRPTQLLRFINGFDKQTYTYSYATPFTPRPTQMTRGLNGTAISITYFVYDDFGRLVETTVPEAGAPNSPAPTRYEYDTAGRMTKKRVGINTPAVRTSVYSYDSLGRTTYVDHDTEHPVDCASAPDGTPIQDEEYRYDNCTGDVPAGFACNNALGKLTIARAIVQCSSGEIVKRGRWYDYDSAGRVSRVGYAVVSGSTILTPSISTKSYPAAGRMSSATSPAASVYGTSYTFDTNGLPTTISTSAGTLIAYAASYRAFGPLKTLSTDSVQPVGSGSRRLKLTNTYRSDNSLQMLDWTMVGTGGASSIAILKDEMTYGPAGLLSLRRDLADNLSSRFYNYDPLLRMTCEARGSGSTVPSSADCVTSSTRLAGLYTYGNGASAVQPPDVRLTSFIKGAGTSGATYTSPSSSGETYTYLNGSGQTQQITRTGSSSIVLCSASAGT